MTLHLPQDESSKTRDPHPAWLIEWHEHRENWEQTDDDSPEGQAAWARREALARNLASVQATTAAGLCAQLAFNSEDLGACISEMVGAPFDSALQIAAEGAAQIAACAAQGEGNPE